MTRFIISFILMGLGFSVNASMGQIGIKEKLNARRILEVIPSLKINKSLMSPVVVRYVKEGDFAPSCGLLHAGEYIDIVSPEPGGAMPSCGARMKKPIYFEKNGIYVVYEYKIEDPRGELTVTFQLYKIKESDVKACQNDEELTHFAMGSIKGKGVKKSFSDALIKFGCL